MNTRTTPVRWLGSPSVAISCAVHVAALVAVLAVERVWPWALAAVVANHLVLTVAGLWPRSRLLGPNWTRLPASRAARGEVAITIDDGPDPDVTPQVLTLLAAHDVRATFFCIGERVERYPELAQAIVRNGHSLENHSQRHRHTFSLLGPAAMRREIGRAQVGIEAVTGIPPRFFRAPAGIRNPFLDPILGAMDLRLASWSHRGFDTVNTNAGAVYRRLTNSLRGGDILLLHDGHAARGPSGSPVILEVLPPLLCALRSRGLTPVTLREALS